MRIQAWLRRALCLLLCLSMLTGAAAFAEETGEEAESEPAESAAPTPEPEPEPEDPDAEHVLDSAELDRLIGDFLAENKRNPENFAMAYTYLETGETYYFNPEMWTYPASIFKLPEMMLIENDVAKGLLEQDGKVCGYPLATALEYILVYSQTQIALDLYPYFGGEMNYRKRSIEMAGWDESMMPNHWEYNVEVCAPLVNAWLLELYEHPDDYPEIVEHLKLAQPDQYFRHNLEGQYEIAQKYGAYEGYNNTCGIIYMPHPILLTVLTCWYASAEPFIGDVASLMADYTLELDARLERQRAEAEAEKLAAEAEEAARLAAEEEAKRQEEERLAEERRLEEERQKQQAAAEATPAPSRSAGSGTETERPPLDSDLLILGGAGAVVTLGLLIRWLADRRRGGRRKT